MGRELGDAARPSETPEHVLFYSSSANREIRKVGNPLGAIMSHRRAMRKVSKQFHRFTADETTPNGPASSPLRTAAGQ